MRCLVGAAKLKIGLLVSPLIVTIPQNLEMAEAKTPEAPAPAPAPTGITSQAFIEHFGLSEFLDLKIPVITTEQTTMTIRELCESEFKDPTARQTTLETMDGESHGWIWKGQITSGDHSVPYWIILELGDYAQTMGAHYTFSINIPAALPRHIFVQKFNWACYRGETMTADTGHAWDITLGRTLKWRTAPDYKEGGWPATFKTRTCIVGWMQNSLDEVVAAAQGAESKATPVDEVKEVAALPEPSQALVQALVDLSEMLQELPAENGAQQEEEFKQGDQPPTE
jgi:hypothetical protein